MKRDKNGIVTETINRNDLWLIQTPQVFRYEALKKSYLKAGSRKDFTDEAALVENAGYKVRIVNGNKENVKITSAEDFRFLKMLI